MAHTESTAGVLTFPDDRALLDRARVGDTGAFEELYRRHAQAAWRLAQAVTRNTDDASDAVSEAFTKVFAALQAGTWSSDAPFRPYLLTAVRNAAIDAMRRSGRFTEADQAGHPAPASAPASDHVVRLEDAALVAAAFRALPERWRSVLWLTEVEGVPAREAAAMLGLSANGTAQLAVRARAGLREKYLQAHLQQTDEAACRHTVERLGAYVAGGLSARDIAKVDQHLAGCESCRTRHAELEDLGTGLRRVMLPLPVALAAAAGARWKIGAAAATREAGVLDFEQILEAPIFRKVLGAAAAAIFTAGMVAAPFIGDDGTTGLPLAAAPDVVQFENTADDPVIVPDVAAPLAVEAIPAVTFDSNADRVATRTAKRAYTAPAPSVAPADTGPPATERARVSPEPAPPPPASSTPTTTPLLPPLPIPAVPGLTDGDTGGGGEAPPTTQAPPVASVGVGGRAGDGAAAVSVTVTDTVEAGAQLGDTVVGTPQSEPPAEDGVSIEIGGGALPPATLTIPLP